MGDLILGGFFDAQKSMSDYLKGLENQDFTRKEREQKAKEWEQKNRLVDQSWEDTQALRRIGDEIARGREESYMEPNPEYAPAQRTMERVANAGDFLRQAQDERFGPVRQQAPQDVIDLEQGLGLSPKALAKEAPARAIPTPTPQAVSRATAPANAPVNAPVGPLAAQIARMPEENIPKTRIVDYTPDEQANMFAKALLKQGNVKGAVEAAKGVLDISEASPEHARVVMRSATAMLDNILASINPATGLPFTPDEAKSALLQYAVKNGMPQEFIRMVSSPMTDVAPGGVIIQNLPNGDTITHTLTADGSVKDEYHKATTSKTDKKLWTPLFDSHLGNKSLEHFYSFHDTDRFTAQQLFDMWKQLGGTKEAAIKLQQTTGGLKYEKGENYSAPAALVIDRTQRMPELPPGYSRSAKDGTIYKQVIQNGKQVRVPVTDPKELEGLGVMSAEYGAGKAAVKTATQSEIGVGTAVDNLHRQIEDVRSWTPPGLNAPIRALNVPANWVISRVIGSGNLNAFHAYNKEMASEIAKIAEGSTGSVKAAAEGLQQDWAKILDKDMPWGEYNKLLTRIEKLGKIRQEAQRGGVERAKAATPNVGGVKGAAPTAPTGPVLRDKTGKVTHKLSADGKSWEKI